MPSVVQKGNADDAPDQPLVSVVVPVYNAQQHVARCLDSVLCQDYENVEIIAIDDGSSDDSGAILDDYSRYHPNKIRTMHQENAGVATTRNRGVRMASGKYLMFLDNDDSIDQNYVSTFVNVAEAGSYDIVMGGYRRPDSEGRIRRSVVLDPRDEWSPYLVVAAWAKIYRTDFVSEGGYAFLPANIGEDICFTLPSLADASRVKAIDYCGYNWTYNEDSVSNTSHRSSDGLQFEFMINTLLKDLSDRGVAIDGEIRHYFIRLIAWFLLYTCKGDGGSLAQSNYQHYCCWLDRNIPDWKSDELARVNRPHGDTLPTRVATNLFVHHPRLMRAALRIMGSSRRPASSGDGD